MASMRALAADRLGFGEPIPRVGLKRIGTLPRLNVC